MTPKKEQNRTSEQHKGMEQKTEGGASESKSARGNSSTAANVHFTTEQRTRIKTTVLTGGAPKVTNVNFGVRVGVAVPRDSVKYVPVPGTLVEIGRSGRVFTISSMATSW